MNKDWNKGYSAGALMLLKRLLSRGNLEGLDVDYEEWSNG